MKCFRKLTPSNNQIKCLNTSQVTRPVPWEPPRAGTGLGWCSLDPAVRVPYGIKQLNYNVQQTVQDVDGGMDIPVQIPKVPHPARG